MPRGPLPTGNARRRNAPTIQSTVLPAEGREGEAPECPYALNAAGAAWWAWAWATPQAAAWDDGALYLIARRAQLETEHDMLASFGESMGELHHLLAGADDEAIRNVEYALGTLKRLATNATSLKKEMRELDNRLGLNPKAMADLRWQIEMPDEAEAAKPARPASVARLRAV